MPKRGNSEWISDIEEAIRRIDRYLKGVDYSALLQDTKTQDAIVRNMEIIGEAAKNISADFKKKHKSVEWGSIAGMRDKLIHHYFGVNWEIVWDIVKQKLPELTAQLRGLQANQ
ncbi:MAG: DUF86 domain-containing protein [Fidelibacterota bacterium]